MGASLQAASSRRQGVEFFRLLAAFGVVLIHFWPRLPESPHSTLDALVVGTSRFAVPFFFAASAHFLRDRLDTFADGWRFARKWVRILLFWHAVHAVWFTAVHLAKSPAPFRTLPDWVAHLPIWDTLMEGIAWPLWYLHSLVLCVLLAAALPRVWRGRLLPPLGAVLFAMALLWGPWWHLAPEGMPPTPLYINPRGFLFTALLPFALGLTVPRVPVGPALGLATLGFAFQTAEILLLPPSRTGAPHEYFLGSTLLGPALLWLGLHWSPGGRAGRFAWGTASLPMYLLQLMVFPGLRRLLETVSVPLFGQGWLGQVAAVCLALPLYAAFCHRIGSTSVWKALHK